MFHILKFLLKKVVKKENSWMLPVIIALSISGDVYVTRTQPENFISNEASRNNRCLHLKDVSPWVIYAMSILDKAVEHSTSEWIDRAIESSLSRLLQAKKKKREKQPRQQRYFRQQMRCPRVIRPSLILSRISLKRQRR